MITIAHESPGDFVSGSAGNALDLGDQLWMSEIDVAFDDSASGTERVIAAAGAVESLEWKLDRARAGLAEAIERAGDLVDVGEHRHRVAVPLVAGNVAVGARHGATVGG